MWTYNAVDSSLRLSWCLIFLVVLSSDVPKYCEADSGYRYYSVKTAYDVARYRGAWPSFEGCEPRLVYLVSRHGIRYSVTEEGQEAELLQLKQTIIDNHAKGHGRLTDEEASAMEQWTTRMEASRDMQLSDSGRREIREFGERLALRIPGLSNTSRYEVRHTNFKTGGSRSRDSAQTFLTGLFGSFDGKEVIENNYPDWLLQYYVFCKAYRQVDDEPLTEREAFLAGPYAAEIKKIVAERIGIPSQNINFETISLLYDTCRFEFGIYRDAPWCSVFDTRALKLLEFGEDIRYYWKFGYARGINYMQSCELVKDLINHLRSSLDDSSNRDTTLIARYGHSGTFQTFISRLGFFRNDFHMKADGFNSQSRRKWRNSLRFPMGGNIVFVVTTCLNGTNKITGYVNEVPVVIPGCKTLQCPLASFLSSLEKIADCDIEEICRVS